MKIPFDIKYRPQIESGEYKVETKDHHPVRIICWNKNTGGLDRIVALVAGDSGQEKTLHYTEKGQCVAAGDNCNKDLFIVTPEKELSDFEHRLCEFATYIMNLVWYNRGLKLTNEQIIKGWDEDLLAIAKKELEPEIKAEALNDLPRWKRSKPESGRNYVLMFKGGSVINTTDFREDGRFYYEDGESYCDIHYNDSCVMWMYLDELLQLPGFKEDESYE